MKLSRREFIYQAALAMGASVAWGGRVLATQWRWNERRDLYPEGVASGDPDFDSVILWTRRPFEGGGTQTLTVEVAEDQAFRRVIARAPAIVSAASDWTCRVLVGGLHPAREYWYRFTDADGLGSRIGRTITAPKDSDTRPVKFAFVSCQNPTWGSMGAYRRMIFEDERAAPEDQLGFVLHLGDFIYELVWYPEDRPKGYYDRKIYDIFRIPNGEKVSNFHIPTDVEGYRTIYRAYLHDPDLQDARARWPFVAMWDNHEFSWQGRQGLVQVGPEPRPGQTVKVAANQAWFEYLPARIIKPSGPSLETFDPPKVENVAIEKFDDNGLGLEPNNLIAIRSLTAYRVFRYGRHLDLFITDQHSYRSENPITHPDLGKIAVDFPNMFPQETGEILDAGRTYGGGKPPAEIRFGDVHIANPRKDAPPQTILGAEQKAWFKERLRRSRATWKIWGNSIGTPDERADPQNLPEGIIAHPWPKDAGYASLGGGDFGGAYVERGEIYDLIHDERITGFAIVSGDKHSFWAGYAAKELPPRPFVPVGLSFVGASITSPGGVEANEHNFPKDEPLRPLFLADRPGADKPAPTINMLLLHGVRSCLEYAKSGDLAKARALSNPDNAPHLSFVDLGGHGYATVRLTAAELRTDFVCIPRPIARSDRPDGGPLRYRVSHVAKLWRPGERPLLEQRVIEGDPGLSI
ncbi:MAG TPA: alkaline phosphatase D family protein [Candidatus Polarisedimenticolaceae bacterium]|nr:alkaline phosphatase D family protein [Candidatus Polarisedimenticolaceae bacterium]